MKNLMIRAISGGVYVALIVVCIFCGIYTMWGLVTLFMILSLFELQNLMSQDVRFTLINRLFDICIAVVASTLVLVLNIPAPAFDMSFIIIICSALLILYFPLRMILADTDLTDRPLKNALTSLLSQIYVTVPLCCLLICYAIDGKDIVFATFIYIWLNDTGAYLSGMSFGRHKLCERLSPKKTWEGFWGGFIFCIIAGGATAAILGVEGVWNYALWIVYAGAVSIFATFGDLFESLVKRTVGVKDSGNLIPGHGGILDRIDSLLAVAPLALVFSVIMVLLY